MLTKKDAVIFAVYAVLTIAVITFAIRSGYATDDRFDEVSRQFTIALFLYVALCVALALVGYNA